MISINEILETNRMISSQHLDVRTITMGISLFDCIGGSIEETCQRVYDKITSKAKDLVKTGNEIAGETGIPIVNKRISVTPVSLITARTGDSYKLALTLDKCAEECGVDFIGGYTALVQKGMTAYEKDFLESIPATLRDTKKLCSSVTRARSNLFIIGSSGCIERMVRNTREKRRYSGLLHFLTELGTEIS